jgi:hypothetical protein
MAWVEVEKDPEPWVWIAGVVGLTAGAIVWWQRDFCTGLFAYLGVGFAVILARQLWSQAWLPQEARRAAKLVLAWYRERFPDERVEGVAVRAIEPDRYVIAVRHGFGMPTPRSYFAIARPALDEITALPGSVWRPRGLK